MEENIGPEPGVGSNQYSEAVDLLNNVYAFKELINAITDYYAFKNNIVEEEDTSGDEWKIGTKYDPNVIIPDNIDSLIEASFESQLKKFINKL